MIAKLKKDISEMRRDVRSLRPSSAPGILTNHTTRGVTRRPIRSESNTRNANNDGTARWA
jgi:hypothetical protein